EKMVCADIVITGEGRLDGQTSMGKAPLGIAQCAAKLGIPVIALAGGVTKEAQTLNQLGITSFFSIAPGAISLEEAMDPKTAYKNLKTTSKQLFYLIKSMEPKAK